MDWAGPGPPFQPTQRTTVGPRWSALEASGPSGRQAALERRCWSLSPQPYFMGISNDLHGCCWNPGTVLSALLRAPEAGLRCERRFGFQSTNILSQKIVFKGSSCPRARKERFFNISSACLGQGLGPIQTPRLLSRFFTPSAFSVTPLLSRGALGSGTRVRVDGGAGRGGGWRHPGTCKERSTLSRGWTICTSQRAPVLHTDRHTHTPYR